MLHFIPLPLHSFYFILANDIQLHHFFIPTLHVTSTSLRFIPPLFPISFYFILANVILLHHLSSVHYTLRLHNFLFLSISSSLMLLIPFLLSTLFPLLVTHDSLFYTFQHITLAFLVTHYKPAFSPLNTFSSFVIPGHHHSPLSRTAHSKN